MVSTVVDEEQILFNLLDVRKIPCYISSPFREDKHPSFKLFRYQGNIFWKDFSTNETGNVYTLVKKLKGEIAAATMFSLDKVKKPIIEIPKGMSCVKRRWNQDDIDYWNSYGVDIELLKKANVSPIRAKIIKKGKSEYTFPAEKYAYVFEENKDNRKELKVYQPFSEKYKWCSTFDNSIWSLWTLLPETGDKVIITSSLKDALNLTSNLGIPAVSLQGEGYKPKPQVMQQIKDRFKDVYVFYDNDYKSEDNPGRKFSTELANEYGLIRLEIPDKYEAKDPSDLYKKFGKEKYLEIIKEILK